MDSAKSKRFMYVTKTIPSPVQAVFLLAIIIAALLHLTITLPMGYISDDYVLMQSAKEGSQLWHLHYAPFMEFLWKLAAAGIITPLAWHFLTLAAHGINTFLVFYIARQAFTLSFSGSLFAAMLFMLNPIGLEALTWISASGYPLMTMGLLAGIALLYKASERMTLPTAVALSMTLTLLQATTFLTWDWAILIAPIFSLFALFATTIQRKLLPLILGPAMLLWMCAAFLRVFSKYGNTWQNNDWVDVFKFAAGSPLLALLPNVSREWFYGPVGLFTAALLIALLLRTACSCKPAFATFVAYLFSIAPWIWGGNPSSRYFYFPVAFLYLLLTCAIEKIPFNYLRQCVMLMAMAVTLTFTFTRLELWKAAEGEAQKLRHHIERIITTREMHHKKQKPLVIVNMPDAFGPAEMPLRPQMWFCGFDAVLPGIQIVKTDDCPFIWKKDPNRVKRAHIQALFQDADIYEIVLKEKGCKETFALVPFNID